MPHDDLVQANGALQAAAGSATDEGIAERLRDQASALQQLAYEDPDHGRMARHESKLQEIAEEADAGVADAIASALEHIQAYRETIEGV